MTQTISTQINWKNDSLEIIAAKQELQKFIEEKNQIGGKSSKVDAYHNKRITELVSIINNN
jgi:predicted transcriptional regulator